ncbi:MAG TPA: hypothetical protein VN840_06860 [Streptosporangiaceae bacterium]|nr:hypothetical protein [Streptosporangiaceae bacterium]
MNLSDNDQLVADYLGRLDQAARALPADRRAELIEEIALHIAEARAADPGGLSEPLAVRNILERLGDPQDIVRAAAEAAFADAAADYRPAGPRHTGTGPAGGDGRGGAGPLEICAVLFLLVGGVVIPVLGWIAGVVLLWVSPRWQTRDKLIGTLVWPGGLLAPAAVLIAGGAAALIPASETVCTGGGSEAGITTSGQRIVHHFPPTCTGTGGMPAWLGITILVILMALAIGGPVYTAIRLLRRAGHAPAGQAAGPAVPIPA